MKGLYEEQRKFFKVRGWRLYKKPVHSKTAGHGSRQRVEVTHHLDYAEKDGESMAQHKAYEYECGVVMKALAVKMNG